MKNLKICLFVIMMISAFSLTTSCDDNEDIYAEEQLTEEIEIYSVDRGDIERPGDQNESD